MSSCLQSYDPSVKPRLSETWGLGGQYEGEGSPIRRHNSSCCSDSEELWRALKYCDPLSNTRIHRGKKPHSVGQQKKEAYLVPWSPPGITLNFSEVTNTHFLPQKSKHKSTRLSNKSNCSVSPQMLLTARADFTGCPLSRKCVAAR